MAGRASVSIVRVEKLGSCKWGKTRGIIFKWIFNLFVVLRWMFVVCVHVQQNLEEMMSL